MPAHLDRARASITDPKLIICDEPVSALDVSVQAQILNLLEDMKARYGLTLMFIAHDLAVVKNVSDRVAVMYLGKLCEVGPPDDLYAQPAHPYTAALLAAIPVPDPEARRDAAGVLSGEIPSPTEPPTGCRFRTRCPRARGTVRGGGAADPRTESPASSWPATSRSTPASTRGIPHDCSLSSTSTAITRHVDAARDSSASSPSSASREHVADVVDEVERHHVAHRLGHVVEVGPVAMRQDHGRRARRAARPAPSASRRRSAAPDPAA